MSNDPAASPTPPKWASPLISKSAPKSTAGYPRGEGVSKFRTFRPGPYHQAHTHRRETRPEKIRPFKNGATASTDVPSRWSSQPFPLASCYRDAASRSHTEHGVSDGPWALILWRNGASAIISGLDSYSVEGDRFEVACQVCWQENQESS